MVRSQDLLYKKGPLRAAWVAWFYGVGKLSREQVVRADIAASVAACIAAAEDVLRDDRTATTFRMLSILLLGIVRIYSKKMDYVCHDSEQLFQSIGQRRYAEPGTRTGRSMHGALKQVKKTVRAGRLVGVQQDTSKVKKHVHAVRTTGSSGLISSEGLSRAETGAIVQTSVEAPEALAPVHLPTFTIPQRFELDSFDLEIDEDRNDDGGADHHQVSRQDILLEDDHHHATCSYEYYQRGPHALDSACFMLDHITLPPDVISAISEVNDILDLSAKGGELRENQNADSACFTPVRDVLPPNMEMEGGVNCPSSERKRGEKSRTEVNKDENTGSPCFSPLPESQEGQFFENVPENVICPSLNANNLATEESENGLLLGKTNTAPPVGEFPEHDIQEHEPLEPLTLSCKTGVGNELSPSTPEPLPEGVPGPPSSRGFGVRTPAKSEKRRVTRKRRRALHDMKYLPTERGNNRRVRRRLTWSVLDEAVVLPNMVMKRAIDDATDLVRKRRLAPHSYLDIWKVEKISSLPDTCLDPLIPYSASVRLGRITTPHAPESSCGGSVKTRRCLLAKHSESSNHSCKDAGNTEQEDILDEPRESKLDGLTDIHTHVDYYTESRHVRDDVCECIDDTVKEKSTTQVTEDDATSTGPSNQGPHESENHIPFHNEALKAALDDLGEDIPMAEEHTRDEGLLSSTRTRRIARCLHQLFLNQKRKQENNFISLSQALEGRKRKTSARFFYETLILKSNGFIQVNQEQPYGDIIVLGTQKLEAEFQSCGN
ncbi:hypothetical protein ACP70R_011411 [Stipagrostis hirtigluma subsp. patula]